MDTGPEKMALSMARGQTAQKQGYSPKMTEKSPTLDLEADEK